MTLSFMHIFVYFKLFVIINMKKVARTYGRYVRMDMQGSQVGLPDRCLGNTGHHFFGAPHVVF